MCGVVRRRRQQRAAKASKTAFFVANACVPIVVVDGFAHSSLFITASGTFVRSSSFISSLVSVYVFFSTIKRTYRERERETLHASTCVTKSYTRNLHTSESLTNIIFAKYIIHRYKTIDEFCAVAARAQQTFLSITIHNHRISFLRFLVRLKFILHLPVCVLDHFSGLPNQLTNL